MNTLRLRSDSFLQFVSRSFFRALILAILIIPILTLASPASAASEGTVIGKITEPDGTTGVCNASVSLHTGNWSYSQYKTTVCDGAFIFTNVPAGTVKLEVWTSHASYFNPDSTSVTVAENQITDLGSVKLLNPNVFGKVTSPDGTTGVSNASITIRTSDWMNSRWTSTDSSGNFKQALSTNDSYIVEVYTWGTDYSRPDNQTITFSGSTVYLDGTNGSSVIRTQNPAMQGKVQLPDGNPAQYASLSLYNSSNVSVQWASTDTNGLFKVDAVDTGTYTLKVYPPYSPAGLVGPDPITVSLTKGTTNTTYQTTPIALSAAKKTISGKVTKSDGTPATDANVSAWQYMGGGYASATTNSSGEYSFMVGTGDWFMSVWPTWNYGVSPDWTYVKGPKKASFTKSNAEAESATVDFSVAKLTATLAVRVQYPNGTAVSSSEYYSASAWSDGNGGNWCQVSNGSCSMMLAPGTFNVSVYGGSSGYGTPQLAPVTLKDNETHELTVTLLDKNSTIRGSVRDTKGKGVSGQSVNTWMDGGNGWGWTTTDSSGNYSLPVNAGKWCVNAYPSWGSSASSLSTILSTSTSYVSTDEPKCVSVAASASVETNFTFEIADATISGTIVDTSGNTLSSMYGWVQARKSGAASSGSYFYYGSLGGSISGGSFTIRVPAGTWILSPSVGYGSDYSPAEDVSVTIGAGETKSDAKLTLAPNNAIITGYFRNAKGDILTDVYGSVFSQKGAAYNWSSVDQGSYTFKVAAGTWKLGCWVDPVTASQYYLEGTCDTEVTVAANETKRNDIFLKEADSTVTVKALTPDGKPLPNALVNVDTSFGATKTVSYGYYGAWFNRNKYTDQNGQVTLKVPAGTYFVTASIDPGLGYINPEKEVVTTAADSPAAVTLKFIKPDATITGTVTVEGSGVEGTFVSASSVDGGYVETETTAGGSYTLSVTGGETWTIVAADETDKNSTTEADKGYREGTTVEAAKDSTATAPTIALGDGKTEDAATLPNAVSTTTATNTQLTLTDEGGASVSVPANTIATSNMTVSITMKPTVEIPDTTASVPATTYGYDLEVRQVSGQNSGQKVGDFAGDATVCIPYTESELTEAGLSETDLTMEYFDETAGSYRDVKTSTVNTDENKVCGTTNHFTKFVLTSAPVEKTTTTPGTPAAPGTPTVPPGGDSPVETPVVTPEVTELSTKQLAVLAVQGGTARIYLYNQDGTLAKSFKPYGSKKVSGAFKLVAARIVDSDTDSLVVYPVSGQRLPVRVMTLAGSIVGSITTTAGRTVSVTVADFNGDKQSELILSSANHPDLTIYGYTGGKLKKLLSLKKVAGSSGGALVAVGNVTGGTTKELVVGNTADGSVRVYSVNVAKKRAARVASTAAAAVSGKMIDVLLADVTGNSLQEIVIRGETTTVLAKVVKRRVSRLTSVPTAAQTSLKMADISGDGKAEFIALNTFTGKLNVAAYNASTKRVKIASSVDASNATVESVSAVVVGDLDANGTPELAVTQSSGSKVKIYNYVSGKLKTRSTYRLDKKSNRRASLLASDLNGDGRRELVAVLDGSTKVTLLRYRENALGLAKQFAVGSKDFKGGFEITAASVK